MTHALQIDTLMFFKKLRAAGADEALADAIVEGLTAADTSNLATKSDIADLRSDVMGEMNKGQSKLAIEISAVRTDLLKYMVWLFIAQVGFVITILQLYPE